MLAQVVAPVPGHESLVVGTGPAFGVAAETCWSHLSHSIAIFEDLPS